MKKNKLLGGLPVFIVAVICLILSMVHAFRPVEKWAADRLYMRVGAYNNKIKIITIDETAEREYGNFNDWSRMRAAELVNYLNAPERKPAVIGFDINYVTERDPAGDAAFVEAAENGGNVVTASTVTFESKLVEVNGAPAVDNFHVSSVEYPYAALSAVSTHGFSDRAQDLTDNYVRNSMLYVKHNDEIIYNFSYATYLQYTKAEGLTPYVPETDSNHMFGIHYVNRPGDYERYSWADVVNGVYDDAAFKDAILLVGAYMPGMQDQYAVPIDHGNQMYGVEIHANIIDSMLRGYSYQRLNVGFEYLIMAILCLVFGLVLCYCNLFVSAVIGIVLSAGYLFGSNLLYQNGWYSYCTAPVIAMIAMYVTYIACKYVAEWNSKHRIMKEFKKYVAPQVLDQMAKGGEFTVRLGGEAKDIAVLFVDIRGFTTLSEALEPEQVVEMLNEYLELTTEAIFANGGTLDKFIGDATMAVFNAPFDLPDYEARAVKTALDIVRGAAKVNSRIKEKIGREVAFGVGVNCGKAVVGNIGCETRMDYTAIGDTVNTAARLEGKALGGQVVISEELKNRLGDRIVTEPLGEMALKGKAEKVQVFEVVRVKEMEEEKVTVAEG